MVNVNGKIGGALGGAARALAFGALLAVAGCGDADQPSAQDVDKATDAPVGTSDMGGKPIDAEGRTAADPSGVAPDATDAFAPGQGGDLPNWLSGRWGLVAGDCVPGSDIAKGLMTVEGNSLKFWESRARLTRVEKRTDRSLRGVFQFDGEGQSWTRDMEFSLDDGVLTRREYGDTGMPGPIEYHKCT